MKKLIASNLNSRMLISIASVAVLICIAFAKFPSNENNFKVAKEKVNPPLKNVNIDYRNYSVEGNKKTILKYETGSIIIIPENAFIDVNGHPIVGSVDIKYREFHNPSDFFVSGIPMTYDSAGVQYQFESAGMLEILAFQNGKPVFVNPEKKIIVEMASQQQEEKYNIYKYDSLAGNWKYIYKDKAVAITTNKSSQQDRKQLFPIPIDTNEKIELTNERNPFVPKKCDKKRFHFDIEVDTAEFPEIATYKGIQFEVDEKAKDFNPLYASITWDDITLEKGKQSGSYLMTLSKGIESHSFETFPVFDGTKYDEALTLYEKLYSRRKEKDARRQRSKDSINILLNRERLDQNDFAKNVIQNASASTETQDLVQRIFVISGFGIWNSDCPASLPKGEQFAATYTDTLGKKLTFKTLYLVEKGRNAMFSIASYSRLCYNPKKKNILWAVTSDNKLAIFEEKDFKKIKIKNDSSIVKMTVINKAISKAYEVRAILNI